MVLLATPGIFGAPWLLLDCGGHRDLQTWPHEFEYTGGDRFLPTGVELLCRLEGLPSSSYRIETFGLVVATYAPSPVHVALDNKAACNIALSIYS